MKPRTPALPLAHLLPAGLLLLLAACGPKPAATPGAAIDEVVRATTHPLAYVAARIAGEHAPVELVVPPGEDPAHWDPPREALARLQRARVILTAGAGYEPWLGAVSLPPSRLVDAARSLPEGALIEVETVTHSHGLDGEHSHAGVAGWVWLDPAHLALQAERVREALTRAWPEHEQAFQAGTDALRADLEALRGALTDALGEHRIVAADPAYAYLPGDVEGFDLDPDGPATGPLKRLEASLEARPAAVLLWPRAPSPEVAALLAEELGLTSVVLEPAANPETGDLLEILGAGAARLAAALE